MCRGQLVVLILQLYAYEWHMSLHPPPSSSSSPFSTVVGVDSVVSVTQSDTARRIHFHSPGRLKKICNKSKKLNFKLTIEG